MRARIPLRRDDESSRRRRTKLKRHIFHLAIPVRDLEASRAFYVERLGAIPGRSSRQWLDIFLWGHQITLHQLPEQVPPASERGVRHFGVILPWEEWEESVRTLRERGTGFVAGPVVKYEGTPQEQAKLLVEDPSENLIELKAYREMEAVFGTDAGSPAQT